MVKIEIKTKGMHCTSCEILVKDSLMEAGVDKVEASYKSGIISVDFDENKISKEDIIKIIKLEGYEIE
tara:strand:- start:5812 stop:6015 length:204 start_codon:yes stop_codon:yes gene_type:complete